MNSRMKVSCLVAAVAMLALVAAPAASSHVSIIMTSMTVDTSTASEATVTVNIENNGHRRIKVDLNVIALGNCTGDEFMCDVFDCTREAVGGVDGVSLDPGDDVDLSVTLPLTFGDYVFRARATGSKGGLEDQKWGVQSATVN